MALISSVTAKSSANSIWSARSPSRAAICAPRRACPSASRIRRWYSTANTGSTPLETLPATSEIVPVGQLESDARAEGVAFRFLSAPMRILRHHDNVKWMEVQHMRLGEPDEQGRRRPIPKRWCGDL